MLAKRGLTFKQELPDLQWQRYSLWHASGLGKFYSRLTETKTIPINNHLFDSRTVLKRKKYSDLNFFNPALKCFVKQLSPHKTTSAKALAL